MFPANRDVRPVCAGVAIEPGRPRQIRTVGELDSSRRCARTKLQCRRMVPGNAMSGARMRCRYIMTTDAKDASRNPLRTAFRGSFLSHAPRQILGLQSPLAQDGQPGRFAERMQNHSASNRGSGSAPQDSSEKRNRLRLRFVSAQLLPQVQLELAVGRPDLDHVNCKRTIF